MVSSCVRVFQPSVEYHTFEWDKDYGFVDGIACGYDPTDFSIDYGLEAPQNYQVSLSEDCKSIITNLVPDVSGPEASCGSDLMVKRIASDRNLFGIGADDEDDPNTRSYQRELDKIENWKDNTYSYSPSTGSRTWVSTTIKGQTEGEV